MTTVTRKSEVKIYLDQCLHTYETNGLSALAEAIHTQILSKKVKFPLLEYCAHVLYQTVEEEEQIDLCDTIEAYKTEGGNVLLGIILQDRLEEDYLQSIQKATEYISKANAWYVCDIIGERVYGYALLTKPEPSIPEIKKLSSHSSHWVVRSVGAGAHYAIKKGLGKEEVTSIFKILLTQSNAKHKEIRQGIGWAAKTTARFHPDIIANFDKEIQDSAAVANWFRKKIEIGLNRNKYAREIEVKSVLNKKKKRDDWFLDDYTFNPYSSCSFNCLYCYIRGSKYGSNLESSLSVKVNAIELLDKQLANRAKKNQYGFIVISSATDPYLSIEKKYELTRKALQLVLKYRFPVHMITKSDLIERDFDLLQQIDQTAILPERLQSLKRGTIISFSFSTLQDEIAKVFEPGATPPSQRLHAVQNTVKQGFHTGISLMPLLPYISDTTEQLHHAFSTFKALSVNYVLPATITLFGTDKASSKTLMLNAIKKHFPELEAKYQRFFANSTEMPLYYRNAFYKKMLELSEAYNLPNRIIHASH